MIKTVTYLGKYTKLYMWHKITEEIQSITILFENAALFLRLGLPSTITVTKTELFENALQTGEI